MWVGDTAGLDNTRADMTGSMVVAVENPLDDIQFKCSITDETGPRRHSRSSSAKTTVSAFYRQIATDLSYKVGTFQLVFMDASGTETALEPEGDERSLIELGLTERINKFFVREGDDPIERVKTGNRRSLDSIDLAAQSQGSGTMKAPKTSSTASASARPWEDSYASSYGTGGVQAASGFVGLANQGATCYLNSLLQSLFMTPEFRSAIYSWRAEPMALGEDGKEQLSIPFELQKLFIKLQTSKARAVETTVLTKSFGWDSGDAFQQQDVQELLRVLFSALEEEWKGSPLERIMAELYQGQMVDFLKCKQCGNERLKPATFEDVALSIRTFGGPSATSVKHALDIFTQVEVLDGDNKVTCDTCAEKTDHTKGLRFKQFPYILTLQLKRFIFDIATMRRTKVNDKVTFDEHLDLSDYVAADAESDVPRKVEYELFSVLIHSGGTFGGHYYAYVKDFLTNEWHVFNDSSVTAMNVADLKKAYGGATSGGYGGSTSAYMLLYRLVDPERNQQPATVDQLPGHVLDVIEAELQRERERQEAEEKRRDQITMAVHYAAEPGAAPTVVRFATSKQEKVGPTLKLALEECGLADTVKREDARLRKYIPTKDQPGVVLDEAEDKSLLGWGFSQHYADGNVLLEMRGADGEFPEYRTSDISLKLTVFNAEDSTFSKARLLRLPRDSSVGDLRKLVAPIVGCKVEETRLALEGTSHQTCKHLDMDGKSLRTGFYIYGGDTIVADSSLLSDEADYFFATELARAVELRKNSITVRVVLPGEEETSEGIPVTVDQRTKLGAWKTQLAELLDGLTEEEFTVHRVGLNAVTELTRQSDTLKMNYIDSKAKIALKLGTALKPGESSISVDLFRLGHATQHAKLCTIAVTAKTTAAQIREKVMEQLEILKQDATSCAYGLTVDPSLLRIRDIQHGRSYPRAMLMDDDTLPYVYKGKRVCVQLLSEPEQKTKKEQRIIYTRVWHPDTFVLDPVQELVVPGNDLEAFANIVEERHGIPAMDLGIATAGADGPFDIEFLEVDGLRWDPKSMASLFGAPLYCDTDGCALILRNNRTKLKKLDAKEKAEIQQADVKRRGAYASNYSWSHSSRKETGVKIITKSQKATNEAAAKQATASAPASGGTAATEEKASSEAEALTATPSSPPEDGASPDAEAPATKDGASPDAEAPATKDGASPDAEAPATKASKKVSSV